MLKKKNNNKRRRISPNLTAVIGALMLMIGGFFLSYNYLQTEKQEAFATMTNVLYVESDNTATIVQQDTEPEEQEVVEEEKEPEPSTTSEQIETYLGYLTIPKINFKRGFFPIDSKQNDVERNIFIVNGSSYPDVEKGNLIIAGHSGSGWKAFFNDLYKLEKGDKAVVNYNGKVYTYSITKIYEVEKNGKVVIYRNYEKTTLTLVTCTNNNSKTQTVYIAELESITEE